MDKTLFWQQFSGLARKAGAKFPDCVAAQAALESGWGAHLSGKNNYFGIKGVPGTEVRTREVYNGEEVYITAVFKNFYSPEECVQYLVDRWYKDYKGYKGVNRAQSRNEAALLLQEEGYATDPVYAELLINLMNQNQPESTMKDYFLEKASLYDRQEAHQISAWRGLEDSLTREQLEAFKAAYRDKPEGPGGPQKFPLDVIYYNQNDSATQMGHRMCFSSSMAMALEFLDPDEMKGDDDWYLKVVLKYGDTVSGDAQVAAARSLGYNAKMCYNGTQKKIEALLDQGIPVPVGILHKGSVNAPSGGGHWICLIGYDETHFWVNDPAGDLDLVNGGYHTWDSGERLRYSKENLLKRWLIDGSGADGWFVDLTGNF